MELVDFGKIQDSDVALVGGKAFSLGRLIQAGIPITNGFVITTKAYSKNGKIHSDLQQKILDKFDELGFERVAVRSSATAEDSAAASFAGQLETYLNTNRQDLIQNIENCWQSLKTKRVQEYSKAQNIDEDKNAVAVIVQGMVDSHKSGVAFTVNPVTNNDNEMLIEASWGLGELIVQGTITPESIGILKSTGEITARTSPNQTEEMVFSNNENMIIPIDQKKVGQDILTNAEVSELVNLMIEVEQYYGKPQDIEWAFADGKLWLLQARPITTINDSSLSNNLADTSKFKPVVAGKTGSIGVASGFARVITDPSDASKLKDGEVLISVSTTPDYVGAFTKASAIVTDVGGVTSHAAVVARELGLPAVVDTRLATQTINDGDMITVNGYTGEVYAGNVASEITKPDGEISYDIPPSGNDIDDLLNAMTNVFVDARELWPMAPLNIFPYFDVDNALDTYLKLKSLVDKGMPLKDIAKLFGRAEQVRYFLINTGVGSIKTAAELKLADIKVEDQVKMVEWLIKIINELTQNDPFCLTGKNTYWNQDQVDKFVDSYDWQEITPELQDTVNKLSINLYVMNWSFYWNYYGAAGYDIHGPYTNKQFDNSQIVVKDFFNPAAEEIWPLAKEVPFKSAMLAQVYKDIDVKISFGNRILNQGELAQGNTKFAFIVNGKQVKDLKTMEEIAEKAAALAQKQSDYVNSLPKMDIARKCAELSFYIHKDFYLHFGTEWYPKEAIEKTIDFLGNKFIDLPPPTGDVDPVKRRKILDPRNNIGYED